MKSVLFATTNARKIYEANETLSAYDIAVTPIQLTIDEIQHADPAEITKQKAITAFEAAGKPVVVSDTSWSIPSLGGFPGGYMKDVSAWLQPHDWLALMNQYEDRTIECHEHLAYYDGTTLQHFVSIYSGQIAREAFVPRKPTDSIECVTILYGDKTMAEQIEAGEVASAGEELYHWQQFAKWYNDNI